MTGASPVTIILSRHSAASHATPSIAVTGLAPVMPLTEPNYECVGYNEFTPVILYLEPIHKPW